MGYTFTKSTILKFMCFAYAAILLWSLYRIATSKQGQFSSAPGPNGHLIWRDSQSTNFLTNTPLTVVYIAGLLIPLLFMKNGKGLPLIAIGGATAAYSFLVAGKDEFGSYWCFTSVAYAIVSLFL